MRTAVSDPSTYVNLDIAFHEAIMEAAGNRLLREARRPLSEVLFSSWLMTSRSAERLARTHEGHEEIYRAIAAGDPVAAREAMRRHIEHFEDNIRADLELPSRQAVTVGSNGHQSAE